MMKTELKKAILNLLGIVAVMGATATLVILNVLNPASFALAALACFPFARAGYSAFTDWRRDTVRRLLKMLPKIGFKIDNLEPDGKNFVIRGEYKKHIFLIFANPRENDIRAYEFAWMQFEKSDSRIPRLLEALSDINCTSLPISIGLDEPDEGGIRRLYSKKVLAIPSFGALDYFKNHFDEMAEAYDMLCSCFWKDRPWLDEPSRSPIGFAPQSPTDDFSGNDADIESQTVTAEDPAEDRMAPAARIGFRPAS